MSLILDALNRSRQDSEQMPGLSSVHPVQGERPGVNWLLWLLVAALALAVLGIGWLLFERLPQPAAPADTPPRVQPPAPPAPNPNAEPPARSQPESPVAAQPDTSIARAPAASPAASASVERAADAPGPASAAPEHRPSSPAKAGPAPIDPGVAALYQQPPSDPAEPEAPAASQPQRQAPPAAASREEEVIDVELLLEKAKAEMAESGLSEHPVPFLSALSQQVKNAVPTLMYLRHDYTGDPARSSVVINGKTLRVGGSTGGVRVEEILPDSVVLEFGGTRFRLRALNSWVNL